MIGALLKARANMATFFYSDNRKSLDYDLGLRESRLTPNISKVVGINLAHWTKQILGNSRTYI